jgi:Peptidase family S41
MRRLLLAAALLAAAVAAGATAAAPPAVAGDLDHYIAELERIHPNPYHAVSKADYRAAADRIVTRLPQLSEDELAVELMRLVALLGERDGHAGLGTMPGRRPFHYYPVVTYGFADGIYVTAAPRNPQLVGRRLVAINGRPLADVLRLVDPLVPSDNPLSLAAHRNFTLVNAEFLHGLGVTPSASSASLTVEGGAEAVLTPMTFAAYQSLMRPAYPGFLDGMPKRAKPVFVKQRGAPMVLTTLDRGRVVYLVYNTVLADVFATSNRLLRLARRAKTRRVIVDLRNNGGGNINTYPYLLSVLKSRLINRPGRLVVLIGRTTFSAAVHFATDLDQGTRARFVGEPTGGSPNHYSDTDPVDLSVSGYTAFVPRIYYEKQPGQVGLQLEPNVPVTLTGADFFAGRDPVLTAALRLR